MLDFSGKKILAPMVRVGSLPMRLLALDMGADIVYTEETIDYRLLKCKRVINQVLHTVDFIDEDQNVVFRTCEREKSNLVLQLGTSSADRALTAAKMVENEVSGIDVNMGCPKEFSLKGGMGAALLSQPAKVKAILTNLVQGLSCPVTCKIRVLPELEETIELVKLIESTGVSAIAVHGRVIAERPQHKNRNHIIRAIAEVLSIPVIANGGSGEINCYEDIDIFQKNTNSSSVMIARQAEKNCSIFRKEGKLPLDDIIERYIKYAIEYDNNVWNTKYCIQQMLGSLQDSERGKILLSAQEMDVICGLWNLTDALTKKRLEMSSRAENVKRSSDRDVELQVALKRRRVNDGDIKEMDIKFLRSNFEMDDLPKTVLWNWAKTQDVNQPKYKTEQYEKSFQSIVEIDNQKYMNLCLEKNKKSAEQAAALVAIIYLGLKSVTDINKDKLTTSQSTANVEKSVNNENVCFDSINNTSLPVR